MPENKVKIATLKAEDAANLATELANKLVVLKANPGTGADIVSEAELAASIAVLTANHADKYARNLTDELEAAPKFMLFSEPMTEEMTRVIVNCLTAGGHAGMFTQKPVDAA